MEQGGVLERANKGEDKCKTGLRYLSGGDRFVRCGGFHCLLLHVFGEPFHFSGVAVGEVGGVCETVAFVGVDDELGLYALGAEGVPHFKALWGGTLAVAVAHDDECGCFGLLDVGDGGAFGVDGGIVVDTGTEERQHPLVNGVLAIVALPVADACAGDGGGETMCLRDGEHGHEAAVAPAGEAEAVVVDGDLFLDGVDAGEDVAEIAVAEVFDVGLDEFFSLTHAAAGIGLELEVAEGGPVGHGAGPGWASGLRRAAVDGDDYGVLLAGVVVGGVGEPALDVEAFVFPLDGFGFGGGLEAIVEVGDLFEFV